MTAPASHLPTQPPPNPEISGFEALQQTQPSGETQPSGHDYGVYVLEGSAHQDGSSGLIFSFNPDILPMKGQDVKQLARNVHLSLLPLKHREQEIKTSSADSKVEETELDFSVEADASPFMVIKDGEIVDNELEINEAIEGREDDSYTVMHSWPAIRLNYDTSILDRSSITRAVGYVLASQAPEKMSDADRELWMQDMSAGVEVESLIDPKAVKPGNPNLHVRNLITRLIEEQQAGAAETDSDQRVHTARSSRIAAFLSALIK